MVNVDSKKRWETVIGAFLIAAVVTWFSLMLRDALATGRLTRLMSYGRLFYVSLFAPDWENPSNPPSAWPQEDGSRHQSGVAHETSTAFWQWVVTSGVMNVDFSIFSGPGLSVNRTRNPETFSSDQNAWCIVANVGTNTPDGQPVLFTRNVAVTNTSQLRGPIRDTLTHGGPLDLDGIVVILNGGSAWSAWGDDLDKKWEECIGSDSASDYPVLRP